MTSDQTGRKTPLFEKATASGEIAQIEARLFAKLACSDLDQQPPPIRVRLFQRRRDHRGGNTALLQFGANPQRPEAPAHALLQVPFRKSFIAEQLLNLCKIGQQKFSVWLTPVSSTFKKR